MGAVLFRAFIITACLKLVAILSVTVVYSVAVSSIASAAASHFLPGADILLAQIQAWTIAATIGAADGKIGAHAGTMSYTCCHMHGATHSSHHASVQASRQMHLVRRNHGRGSPELGTGGGSTRARMGQTTTV